MDNEFIRDVRYCYIPLPDAGYTFCTPDLGATAFQHCGEIVRHGNTGFC